MNGPHELSPPPICLPDPGAVRYRRASATPGFVNCTPIQAQTLPIALRGQDVAGQAQTGTGKTAAFLIALYQKLLTHPAPPGRTPTSMRA